NMTTNTLLASLNTTDKQCSNVTNVRLTTTVNRKNNPTLSTVTPRTYRRITSAMIACKIPIKTITANLLPNQLKIPLCLVKCTMARHTTLTINAPMNKPNESVKGTSPLP